MEFTSIVLVLLVLTSFNSAEHFQNGGSPRTIGGIEVEPHSHPHQVILNIHQERQIQPDVQCGGSVIGPEWIVSAAHCNDIAAKYIFAIVGAHDIGKYEASQQMKVVSQFIKHPAYNPENSDNDIALLKIESAIVFNDQIKPIRLPSWSQKDAWLWGYSVITTGWGQDSYDDDEQSATTLQAVESKVITNFYCWFQHNFSKIKDFHICVDGSDGKAASVGDSGGPLVMKESDGKYTLIGINSMKTHRPFSDTVFIRITNYLEWIAKTTGIPTRQ